MSAAASPRPRSRDLWRTAVAVLAAVWLSFVAARWVTHDFQVWTAEGARRLETALHPRPSPPVFIEGPGLTARRLDLMLSTPGTATIADFMYARCISICTALGGTFQRLQESIAASPSGAATGRVRLLSITFDPGHDSVAVLAAYAARMHADPKLWAFARSTSGAGTDRLLEAYGITVVADEFGGYEHNAALLVIDPQGRWVRVFDQAEADLALAFAASLVARPPGP